MVLVSILRRRASIDKGLKATPQTGMNEITGTGDICCHHRSEICLSRVRTVSRQMKNPIWPEIADGFLQVVSIREIRFNNINRTLKALNSPRLMVGPNQ